MKFFSQKPHFEYLKKKWIAKSKDTTENLVDKHLRQIALSSLGGLMLLNTPGMSVPINQAPIEPETKISSSFSKNASLAAELKEKLPSEVRALSQEEENQMTQIIESNLGIKTTAEMDGKRLNRSYGMIGGEQHLYRYPGDTVHAHSNSASDWSMYGGAGIAPGLGAWGYFAPSKEAFSKEDEERERYYIAVQTFLSPGYSERVAEYRDFYKYRKMLLVNPQTGQAVVTDIADAGPSEFTGKHLGGSPEVMHELGLAGGPRKGAVLYFFLDDPDNKVALGPVKLTQELAEN